MKKIAQLVGCFLLGCLVVVLISMFSSDWRQLQVKLEKCQFKKVNLEHVTLRQVAMMLETNLAQQGVYCRVVVENGMLDKSVPRFLIGDADGIIWICGVASVFQCQVKFCDKNTILFYNKVP